jgi:hypothetical protein
MFLYQPGRRIFQAREKINNIPSSSPPPQHVEQDKRALPLIKIETTAISREVAVEGRNMGGGGGLRLGFFKYIFSKNFVNFTDT